MLGHALPPTVKTRKRLIMSKEDIYKELRLRGYNYSGLFKSIQKYEDNASIGHIEWTDNAIAFMDNMLQLKVLQMDTRNLYVPTMIKRLIFDGTAKKEYVKSLNEGDTIPVYVNNDAECIRCDFVEIHGLEASPIQRKKPLGEPVLECYKFVPNKTSLSFKESLRVNVQIALENLPTLRTKIVEVPSGARNDYLAPLLLEVLGDLPLMQPEVTILTAKQLEIEGITIENKPLQDESKCFLVILDEASKSKERLHEAFGALLNQGFVLSRENLNQTIEFDDSVTVLTVHETEEETLVLLTRKKTMRKRTVVEIKNDPEFQWLPLLQAAIKTTDVVAVSQNQPESGILGLINCLRKELLGANVQCVFICDEAPPFCLNNSFYTEQLKNGFAINVFKNGQWGTYRHLILPEQQFVESEHCFVESQQGDFSSLRWVEGSLGIRKEVPQDCALVQVS